MLIRKHQANETKKIKKKKLFTHWNLVTSGDLPKI